MARGGKRPGAGAPKGWDKARAHQRLRELVWEQQDALHEAQIRNAMGIKYLVAREKKTGKFVEVTEAQAKDILSGKIDSLEALEVWEKQPSIQAYADLMNRVLGKPAEHVELDAKHEGEITFRWAGK